MTVHGIRLDRYKIGDTVLFRRPQRFEINYSSYYRPEFPMEDTIPFIVGVSTLEWLEAEMRRRVYQPMIETRLDPARLPT